MALLIKLDMGVPFIRSDTSPDEGYRQPPPGLENFQNRFSRSVLYALLTFSDMDFSCWIMLVSLRA
ncbi:Uncharacterised protein [Enterobacter cloacae]|nr:Uncharacterised protein [Enterobacter cloacae]SAH58815.1 Uncharacterised protein [Enterobacter cloacae]VAL49246.1 Uncharacterised protein [Enterobacter kobei]